MTTFFSSSMTGLFKICAIAPTNSKAEFKIKSVSASKVITYCIFGIQSLYSSMILARNTFSSLPNRYSLNCVSIPLFLSQPK